MPAVKLLLPALALLAAALTACTPSTAAAFGEGLASGLSSASSAPLSAAPTAVGVDCRGSSFGTFTQAPSSLSVTVTPDGLMSGTFSNNGTVFVAQGRTNASVRGSMVYFSQVNLSLDSRVGGSAGASVGVSAGLVGTGASVGARAGLGSTGTLTGTIDGGGTFNGSFRGLQGTYRTTLRCTGA